MKSVLGISGSPRDEGNTAHSLRICLERIESGGLEAEYFSLAGRKIHPCDGCAGCRDTGECVHRDDMGPLYEALRRCDGLILASPVYMGLVTGQMKSMMDRTVVFRRKGRFELSGKIGAGIACGGFRNGGQELTLQCMHTYFLQQDMLALADGPPYSHSGAGIAGSAEKDEIGLETVRNVADRMIKALSRLA